MALFLPDDHDHLIDDLFAHPAGENRARDEHGRIDVVFAPSADLGIVVVDVFQNVLEADALRMADDAHPVHGRQGNIQLALGKIEQVFQPRQLVAERAAGGGKRAVPAIRRTWPPAIGRTRHRGRRKCRGYRRDGPSGPGFSFQHPCQNSRSPPVLSLRKPDIGVKPAGRPDPAPFQHQFIQKNANPAPWPGPGPCPRRWPRQDWGRNPWEFRIRHPWAPACAPQANRAPAIQTG